MTARFVQRVVLVTGGSSGIGRAACLAFAREGAKVVVSDRVIMGGEETAHSICQAGGDAIFVKADVAHAAEVEALIHRTLEVYQKLDCAFNNAGIEGMPAATADCTEENWDQMIAVNLKGVFLCMKYEIPHLLKQKQSSIVNCSSVAGLVGIPGSPAYNASKHGVVGLTRTAAIEYVKTGLRVNAICPGLIHTPMIDRVLHEEPKMESQLLALEPIGRMGTPEEVAETVLWLCSDAASFITGQALAVDGGWTAQ